MQWQTDAQMTLDKLSTALQSDPKANGATRQFTNTIYLVKNCRYPHN